MRLWPWKNKRRYFKRLDTDLPAVFCVYDAGQHRLTPPQEARVINLTHEGCCLTLNHLYLEGFHLARCLEEPATYPLELTMRPPDSGVWRVQANVRWINRDLSLPGGEFHVGLAFPPGKQLSRGWRRLVAVK